MDFVKTKKSYTNKNIWFKCLIFFISVSLSAAIFISLDGSTALAADGDLDTNFQGNGMRVQNRTQGTDYLRALAVRADGSFVVGRSDVNNQ